MKRYIVALIALIVAAFAIPAPAVDADASFREGTRTQVQSNLFATAVTFPGHATVTSNLTVSGRIAAATINAATISTNATVGGTLGVTGVATFTAQPVFNAAILAAPTNTANAGLSVKINGTNYVIAVAIPNT